MYINIIIYINIPNKYIIRIWEISSVKLPCFFFGLSTLIPSKILHPLMNVSVSTGVLHPKNDMCFTLFYAYGSGVDNRLTIKSSTLSNEGATFSLVLHWMWCFVRCLVMFCKDWDSIKFITPGASNTYLFRRYVFRPLKTAQNTPNQKGPTEH